MDPAPPDQRNARFATTRWSVVLDAGHRSSADADTALAVLCECYWYPLYAWARRRGCRPEDAADRTQEFFARLIERNFLQSADPERGRFRTFLLTAFQRFLANRHEYETAQKRGGGRVVLSIDAAAGEERYAIEPADPETVEAIFNRNWAVSLLNRVLDRLRSEYATKDKLELFEHCRDFLPGVIDGGYEAAAAELQMSEVAVRVAAHRMRRRYRDLIREEVSATVASSEDVEDELRHLVEAVRA